MPQSQALAVVVAIWLSIAAFAQDCPELVGRWPYGTAASIAVVDGYGLVGGGDTIFVVDLSAPETPRFMAHTVLQGNPDHLISATDMAVSGSFAYVAAIGGGLRVFDVTDPAAVTQVASLPTWPDQALAVAVAGSSAYLLRPEGI